MQNTKTIRNAFIGLALFISGFLLRVLLAPAKKEPAKTEVEAVVNDTPRTNVSAPVLGSSTDYAKVLKGKFILKGADYAGFNFVDSETLTWTNELFPMDPDTMKLRWLSANIFAGTFTGISQEGCPPLIWIRKVESYSGEVLKLKELQTSLKDFNEETLTFSKDYSDELAL